MTTTPKLSLAQRRFMDRMGAQKGTYDSPHTNGRASVSALSAWHRTAESLARLGLVKITSNGSQSRARFTDRVILIQRRTS